MLWGFYLIGEGEKVFYGGGFFGDGTMDQLKRWGELCGAAAAMWVVLAFLVSATGGHLPPWATFAWAQTQEELMRQNSTEISQLNTLVLSDKVSQLEAAVAAHPGDPNLQASLNFWRLQLQAAQGSALKSARH
jgi:hypothetical protein